MTPISAAGKKKRSSGGQPGHRRHERPLIPTDDCQRVEPMRPDACERCGSSLDGVEPTEKPSRHQVVDLPDVEPEVTKYQWPG